MAMPASGVYHAFTGLVKTNVDAAALPLQQQLPSAFASVAQDGLNANQQNPASPSNDTFMRQPG